MKFISGFKICLVLVVFTLLCPSMSWGELSVVFFDDFDDGDYNGWTVDDLLGASDVRAPDVVASPEGYSVRGTGSGYHPDWSCYLLHPLNLQDAQEISIEMRAKSGPQWPNCASVFLLDGQDYYCGRDYGEAGENETADWIRKKDQEYDQFRYFIGSRAFEWHTFAWTRDSDGWWSLSIDDVIEAPNFRQDLQITFFDNIELALHRDQSEIEWIRISTSEPLTHDECANAIPVEADEPYNGSTSAATGTDTSSCSYNDTFDGWHSFTPKFNYEYTISLCGSAFDTTLSVFDECGGTELACNDDTEPGICTYKLQSQLTVALQKGSTYFIRVAGYDGVAGDYVLTITGPQCTEKILGDVNNDCKIDFVDFAVVASHWLECNLDPPSVCWD